MPGNKHFLTDKDVRKVKKGLANLNAGKGVLSRRSTPHRRRQNNYERYRAIRGQSVGANSSGTFDIDNVVPLEGGNDPVSGNPATTVLVTNIHADSYADNEFAIADYNAYDETWELRTKPDSAAESPRLIRGQVVGDVTADDSTFTIDGVLELASGTDPGASITVNNTQAETFEDNTWVTCIFSPTVSETWEVLWVERYRAIQGLAAGAVVSSDATFPVDNIAVLDHGVDPRSDPTSGSETITVQNVHSERYPDDAVVVADYCAITNTWRARARPAQKLRKAVVYSTVAASTLSGSDIDPGTGTVKLYTRPATAGNNWVFVDAEVTAWNLETSPIAVGDRVWIDEEGYVVPGGIGGGGALLVKITGTITARSGTTLGTGSAQPVRPTDLTSNVGSTITVKNTVTRALSGVTETVYCRAVPVADTDGTIVYFIDPLDPIWFLSYTGAAAGTVLGFDDSATTAELEFRQGIEDVQVDAANFQLEKKVFGSAFTDYHTGGEC